MSIWTILAAIIAPAVFWIGYYYLKDRFRPEPPRNLLYAFLLGFLFGIFCYFAYRLLPLFGLPSGFYYVVGRGSRLGILAYSVGIVGVLEETFKFLPFLLVLMRLPAFDEKIDGIIYASAVAVGFASFENLGYLPLLKGFAFFGRAIASPLTHTIFSSVWGYMVGVARIEGRPLLKPSLIGLALAALFHGLFNFLTVSPTLRMLSALLILAIWTWLIRILERTGKKKQPSESPSGSSSI